MNINVVNQGNQELPQHVTEQSAGLDLRADIKEPVILKPLERMLIPTGLHIQLPKGYVAMVCPRSGLALKKGLTVINAPGIIDADYTGDVGVPLINLSNEDYTINPGERVAQMVVVAYQTVQWKPVEQLEQTERGSGGFGHSGVK